jgi:hypothetical protein
MTISPATPAPLEPLEAFPIPEGAILLPPEVGSDPAEQGDRELRRLALAALRQAMAGRQLNLPLGPQTDLLDPQRLLALNRFAVQLLTTGLLSDAIAVPLGPWRQSGLAPQLLVVAAIDEENGVAYIPGVLTASEFAAEVSGVDSAAESQLLPLSALKGGIERLFTLTALLEPAAIPRTGLLPAGPAQSPAVVRVGDWLSGLIGPALEALGGELIPLTAGAFRQAITQADAVIPQALAILSIPLGLTASGELVSGEAARRCVERFELRLIPTGEQGVERLTLQLVGMLAGDLLPDGLLLAAVQGSRRQSVSSASSTLLQLQLPATPEVIEVTLTPPGGRPLVLPPLQLPAG